MRRPTRSDKFLKLLSEFDMSVILTHDTPDPDAIAAGWALETLIRERLKKSARLVAGGAIMRAENLRMLEVLKPPLELMDRLEVGARDAVVMVDCVPTAANHLLGERRPEAVIDHHAPRGPQFRVRFRDIRPQRAATAVIAGEYLREQNVQPSEALATALLYGIRTDAVGRATLDPTDRRVMSWLSAWVNYTKLAEIERAPLSRGYYGDLLLALKSTFAYGDAALCFLPRASGPEIVGEVADLLIRCREFKRVMCTAAVGEDVLVSLRTRDEGGDASQLVQETLKGIGFGGGHTSRAGGKLDANDKPLRLTDELQAELRTRWLAVCGVDQGRGTRLVARKEILEDL